MATVRKLILDAVLAGLAAIDNVGVVVDAARALPGDADGSISEQLAVGKYAIELVVMDDSADEEHDAVNLEAWVFEAAAIVHLPDALPLDGEGNPRDPYDVAAEIYGEIYKLCRPAAEGVQTWGGRAIDTRVRGGGGVGIGARGTRETAALFGVYYRHLFGDPEVTA